MTNSQKEVLFLGELEEVLELTQVRGSIVAFGPGQRTCHELLMDIARGPCWRKWKFLAYCHTTGGHANNCCALAGA